ncbi:hypothetical protein E2562_016729 [Oryza meyeriana var. granulata]|uniref:Uncharacterized protein n=1 Tax=Oryza meyeriana var. granulata TaxID=110450 RepID=A0A6G1BX62_9ORYZ|nr:hypothetical protein E2562_016729 [Oryza meyeriana var. granulata]
MFLGMPVQRLIKTSKTTRKAPSFMDLLVPQNTSNPTAEAYPSNPLGQRLFTMPSALLDSLALCWQLAHLKCLKTQGPQEVMKMKVIVVIIIFVFG